jgi:hypothetical protein
MEMEFTEEDLPLLAEFQARAKSLGMPFAAAMKHALLLWIRQHSDPAGGDPGPVRADAIPPH